MSLLLDVMRRAGTATARNPAEPLELEFEPIDAAPPAPERPTPSTPAPTGAASLSAPPALSPVATAATRSAPHWPSVVTSGGASALAAACWLWLAPAPAVVPPANAAPPPAKAPDTPPIAPLPARRPADAQPAAAPPPPGARTPRAAAPRRSQPPAEAPVHFSRAPAGVSPVAALLDSAHTAYGTGDLAHARARYLEVLASEPDNPDALTGLGAIALQEGRRTPARQFFQRALLARPLDPVAVAGLSRAERPDPIQAESRLKDSLAAQPEAAGTQLALGDTFATQQRWAEAQQAYFQAHGLAPDNPDIAYNLAVALDHLGQRRPAASFYRQALRLAERQPARFPRHLCETRLHALQAQDPPP